MSRTQLEGGTSGSEQTDHGNSDSQNDEKEHDEMRRDSTLSFFEQRRPDWVETLMPVVATGTHRTRIQGPGWNRREGPTSWGHFTESLSEK